MRAIAVREDIRDLILDAADRLLGRYGFKKMTMDDLADEVGVAKGTLYLHFGSKEEVALARVDRVIARLCEELRKTAHLRKNPANRLCTMLIQRVMFRFDSARHYAESIDQQLGEIKPALLARREKYFQEEAQIFSEVLEEGRREKAFFFKDGTSIARTLLTATNALLPGNLNFSELSDRQQIEERVAHISQLLVNGLSVKKLV